MTTDTTYNEMLRRFDRRMFVLAVPVAVLLHGLAVASVWPDMRKVGMLSALTIASVTFNGFASVKLSSWIGRTRTELIRNIANASQILFLGAISSWAPAYWLWIPFLASVQHTLVQPSHWRMFLIAGPLLIVPAALGADHLDTGFVLTCIGVVGYAIGRLNGTLASEILAERADHLEQLAYAHRELESRAVALDESNAELERRLDELSATQQQLLDASHRAGMAEVATGILHNLGNALTSITISAQRAAQLARSTTRLKLEKAVNVLRADAPPPASSEEKERAERWFGYVQRVLSALESEAGQLNQEVGELERKVEHVSHIVQRQQALARCEGFTQSVQLGRVLRDAIELARSIGTSPGLEITPSPILDSELLVDRNKLIQILTNLLSNAADACACRGARARIAIYTRQLDGDRIEICIEDNGSGIRSDDLTRIFGYGFTSKPSGSGFGLHTSACTASELGGRLTASSPGEGLGATFSLVLPRRTPHS